MFTPEERARLRTALLESAAADARLRGAAITGSAAAGREDRWSDIDLAFGVAGAAELPRVLEDWTARMYGRHAAIHHCDVVAGPWTYRVFLLPGGLQVDLAFVSAAEFRAVTPAFRLVAGEAQEPRYAPPAPVAALAGMGWLYALHARTAVARAQWWQAEYMISGVRDHALALAAVRHSLPAAHARGADRLPADVTGPLEEALVRGLEEAELRRAFRAALQGLLREIRCADAALADRLEPTLSELIA